MGFQEIGPSARHSAKPLRWLWVSSSGRRAMCREAGERERSGGESCYSWVLEVPRDSGQELTHTHLTHTHAHTPTHTHFYRYWPDVQDVPIKKAGSNFHFLLCENPHQDHTAFSLLWESWGKMVTFSNGISSLGCKATLKLEGLLWRNLQSKYVGLRGLRKKIVLSSYIFP